MNVNKQNLIVEQQSEGWRFEKRSKTAYGGLLSMHIHPNCVSAATSTGGTFISSSSAGNDSGEEGFGVVRRVLKRRLHQRPV